MLIMKLIMHNLYCHLLIVSSTQDTSHAFSLSLTLSKIITLFLYVGPKPIEVNQEFEMGKLSEYADGSMNNWSHHVQYILPQVSRGVTYRGENEESERGRGRETEKDKEREK